MKFFVARSLTEKRTRPLWQAYFESRDGCQTVRRLGFSSRMRRIFAGTILVGVLLLSGSRYLPSEFGPCPPRARWSGFQSLGTSGITAHRKAVLRGQTEDG